MFLLASQYCGDIDCKCCKPQPATDKSGQYTILGVILLISVGIIGAIIYICNNVNNVQNVSSITPSTIRLPRTDNRSLPSLEPRREENNNSNGRRVGGMSVTQYISSSPPKYDDIMRQNSVTITMQQQSLLPPSYDDFMRRNNRKLAITSL